MSLAIAPAILPPRAFARKALRVAAASSLLMAASLQAAADPVQETLDPGQALVVKVEDGYLFDFSSHQGEKGVSLYQFVMAAAWGADRIILWDEETEALLRKQRVDLEGTKTVSEARFVQFLQTALVQADFVAFEHGEYEAKVIQILPFADAGSSLSPSEELITIKGDQCVFDFGAPAAEESATLYEFAQSCSKVSGLQFTWDQSTEELLKERSVGLRGKRSLPKYQLSLFFAAVLSISDLSCTTIGDGDISVIMVQPLGRSGADAPVESPTSTPSLRDPLVLSFGTKSMAESKSLLELASMCQQTTGRVLTWNQDTGARLTEQRIRLVGTRSMQREAFLPLFQSLMTASHYSWEAVTKDVGPRIKIQSL